MPTYLICDVHRFKDLCHSDTTADTLEQARVEAEKMTKKWGCKVYVLKAVSMVEGQVETQWVEYT